MKKSTTKKYCGGSQYNISLPPRLESLCDMLAAESWRDTTIPWLDEIDTEQWQKIARSALAATRHDARAAADRITDTIGYVAEQRINRCTIRSNALAYLLVMVRYDQYHTSYDTHTVPLGDRDFLDPDAIHGSEW
jgi:hypothetical protein